MNHGPNTEPLLEGTALAQSVRGNKAAQNLTDDPNSHNNPVHHDYDATYCRNQAPREGTNFSANTGLFNLYQKQKINKFKDSLTLLIKFIQREWTRSIPFIKQQGQPVSVQVVHEIPSTIIKKTKILKKIVVFCSRCWFKKRKTEIKSLAKISIEVSMDNQWKISKKKSNFYTKI